MRAATTPPPLGDRFGLLAVLEELDDEAPDRGDVLLGATTIDVIAEPAQHRPVVGTDQDAGRVDPPVHDPTGVQVGQRRRYGRSGSGHLDRCQRPSEVDGSATVRHPELPPVVGPRRAEDLDDTRVGRTLEPLPHPTQAPGIVTPGPADDHKPAT
ncbi:MAG: hypothetical protein ACRDYW_06290 [Acidimicrobiales bacterium]